MTDSALTIWREKLAGVYDVTPDGRVLSMTGWRGIPLRELAQRPDDHGYPSVRLVIRGRRWHVAADVRQSQVAARRKALAAAAIEPKEDPS